MITKIKTNSRSSGRNYDSYDDLDYIGDGVMINNRQRKTLIDLYSRNLQESERENRICELENLTSLEAEEIIFQFLSATWH
ncbi:MAG: hypothetical protein WCW04_00005 [Candidatus Paceibacterota bacterium]